MRPPLGRAAILAAFRDACLVAICGACLFAFAVLALACAEHEPLAIAPTSAAGEP